MHIHDFDNFSGSLIDLISAIILILILSLGSGLGRLVPIISDLGCKRLVGLEWVSD